MRVLGEEGVGGVRVERLARDLATSKSGFYWHFKDRRDLFMQMLEYWAHEYTEVLSENPELRMVEPRKRLHRIAELVLEHDLSGYDLAFLAWAEHDGEVARRVNRVIRLRLDYVQQALAELGITGDEREFRSRTFVCYMAWQGKMYPALSKKRRRELVDRLVVFLTDG